MQAVPQPLPEALQGDRWRFASLPAAELDLALVQQPLPIREIPAERLPLALGLASTVAVPGVVIDAGRRAMALARWLQQQQPTVLRWVGSAELNGLVLETEAGDRWILATFDDAEVAEAARRYAERQQVAQGLHFLLIRPDDSGMTRTGAWLLQG